MGFRDNDRGSSRGGFGRDRDNRSGGRSFGEDRDNRRFGGGRNFNRGRDRPRTELFDTICDKCKSKCKVPFKPSGSKPVLCSDCFKAQGNTHEDFSGGRERGSSGGVSVAQFNELNTKVDKILEILENVEIEDDDDVDEEE